MKKILGLLLIVLLVSVVLLTGCGGSDSASDADQAQSEQSEPAKDAAKEEATDADKVNTEGMGNLLSSAYVDMMKGNEYLMKYKFTMDYGGQSMEINATMAKKGDDMAMISDMMGAETTTIIKGGKVYMVDHNSKTVMAMAQTPEESAAAAGTGSINMEGVTYLGTGNEDGLVYEEYSTSECKVKYYFDGKKLVKMAVDVNGQIMVMEILEMSKDVPDSMFEIPAGYQEVSLDGQ